MYPSCLSPVKLSSLKEGSQALVVEVGGSNLYGARIGIRNGFPYILTAHTIPLTKIIYSSSEEFFNMIISMLDVVIRGKIPDAIGIVYSFAGKPVKTARGVDVYSVETLTKEFIIPGISKRGVGAAFVDSLKGHYPAHYSGQPVVVLNDTVATLFSGGSKMGGVVGTGFNIALDTPLGIVNSESGSFAGITSHQLSSYVDSHSLDPGKGLAEKQVSGVYLSDQLKRVITLLSKAGLTSDINKDEVSAKTITQLLMYQGIDPAMLLLQDASARLRDRSAQIVGMMIATIFLTFPEIYKTEKEEIPIEGSIFWNIPGYQQKVSITIKELAQKKVSFLNIPEAGRLGAGVAALSYLT